MIGVRCAEQRDAHAAIDVVRRSIGHLCVADHHNDHETLTTWLANKTPHDFVRWLSNADNFCVVAESNDGLLGVGVLQRRGEILLFYLAPGAQRRGIGKKIHATLEAKAVQWGLASLHLDSTVLACHFYEALGYKPMGPPVPRFGVLRCFPYVKQL
ncbi:GNAT family N-acetyltransferase [Dokdonella soli]|uniref:N-acetyltransferase domain-containing protein n=1 Tax=Dokdonella soli TaxID=529810 RepID=A0ABN1IE90_9GAMM